MKIGILGTHGIGKTTFAMKMASDLKRTCPEKSVGLLSEVVRECPLPVNQAVDRMAQEWIFHRQLSREIEMGVRNDILVCDRTVLDSIAYSERAGFKGQAILHLSVALEWIRTYDELYFLRPGKHPADIADDGFRDLDRGFQRDIDEIMLGYVESYNIQVIEVGMSMPARADSRKEGKDG